MPEFFTRKPAKPLVVILIHVVIILDFVEFLVTALLVFLAITRYSDEMIFYS